jgi:RNA polymerase sigma factor (sigma-70 family)
MSEAAAHPGFVRLLSDERLARRAVAGDERAFAAIFRRYHQSLFRFCLAIVGNPEDAQDALQNTMMKVLRALPGEEREIELKPWLYRIAHNESIDLLRRRRETRELDVEQVAPGYGLAEDAATRERLRRLLADMAELPERQREVLVMRELSGLGFEEIGSALGTSGAVARQTLYEARQSLHQMEEGREMSCQTVAKALSDGDGRVTRRRDVRAHLRSCSSCQRFREEIECRQRDLAALSPLPAIAAAGMLHGLIGSGGGAGAGAGLAATLGGGAAKTIGASTAAKGVAAVALAAAIGVTAADQAGVVHLGLPGERTTKSSGSEPAGAAQVQGAADSSNGASPGSATTRTRSSDASDAAKQPSAAPAGKAHGREQRDAMPAASANGYGPDAAHPQGRGHEKQHPPAASKGQEKAAGHKQAAHLQSDGGKGQQLKPSKPSHPASTSKHAAAPQSSLAAPKGKAKGNGTPLGAASQPGDSGAAQEKIP